MQPRNNRGQGRGQYGRGNNNNTGLYSTSPNDGSNRRGGRGIPFDRHNEQAYYNIPQQQPQATYPSYQNTGSNPFSMASPSTSPSYNPMQTTSTYSSGSSRYSSSTKTTYHSVSHSPVSPLINFPSSSSPTSNPNDMSPSTAFLFPPTPFGTSIWAPPTTTTPNVQVSQQFYQHSQTSTFSSMPSQTSYQNFSKPSKEPDDNFEFSTLSIATTYSSNEYPTEDMLPVVPHQELARIPPKTSVTSPHRTIDIVTNHFLIDVKKQTIFQYTVDFMPDVERIGFRKKLLGQHREVLGNHYAFDGSMLFLQNPIGNSIELKSVPAPPKKNSINLVTPPVVYTIRISYVTQVSSDPDGPSSPQLFNITFNEILRILKLKPLGRHHFDPARSISIPQHNVELWPGYFTTISNNNMAGPSLVVDVTHKVLRTDTVLDFLIDISHRKGGNWRQLATKQLCGQIVLTRYSNRTYRIDDIDWNKTPASTFQKRSTAEEFSYLKYYAITYNKSITNMQQPLLVHHHHRRGLPDETIYLIPELCSLTGITDAMRADYRVMKDIAEHTRVRPPDRGAQICDFVLATKENREANEKLEQMGLLLDSEMLTTKGKVFSPEKIIFGKKSHFIDATSADWSKECRNSQLFSCVPLKNWLLFYTSRNKKEAEELAVNLVKVGISLGFPIDPPQLVEYRDDNKASLTAGLKAHMDEDLQCIVCIVPTDAKDRYDSIKQLCCTEIPVPSQCVKAKTLSRAKSILSVCSNIARQISCKIGGELWRLEVPLKRTMIVGIDVYHDTVNKGQSVAGFCASMNSSFTKYFSPVSFQKTGQELIDGLRLCMHEALKQFFALNKFLPEIIIVYRDGVGDGMLDAVVDHEIPQMRATFDDFGPKYNPRLAVVIVKKRIHTRLFAKISNSLINPPPGTLVDTACVHKNWYDFFLVSQYVSQGTVTPTHYHVVYDTTGIEAEHMQLLTYKMCHLYMNWTGTIRVPAPCQYAHKNAYLVGQSLHRQASVRLLNNLYFL